MEETGRVDAEVSALVVHNREHWLKILVEKLGPMFAIGGMEIPPLHVSVGFPSSGGTKLSGSKTIGQCWKAESSADGRPQIFISPLLDDSVQVAAVVVHELIHAIHPDAKHGKQFKEAMGQVGLVGKATHTIEGPELKERLHEILTEIGAYPHPKLTPALSGIKKQTTRMLKVTCLEKNPDSSVCGYQVRTTAKWLEKGKPWCPIHEKAMEPEVVSESA